MLLERKKNEPAIESYKEAPCIVAPFVEADNNSFIPFNGDNSFMNQIVSGYSQGPKDSYAKELMEDISFFYE